MVAYDANTVTDMSDHGEIVADHQHGRAVIATQAGHQIENLGLDRGVDLPLSL